MKNIIAILFLGFGTFVMAQDTYTLTDKSSMTINGSSTLHDWTVIANTMYGSLDENGETIKAVAFSVKVADILSDRAAAMDNKMHEALKKEEHPEVMFTVKNTDSAMGGNQELKGTLNIAGVEKEVSVPANISQADGNFRITGEKKIILADYGMEPPKAMFGTIVVGDDVTVKFDLIFKKS